MATNTAPVRRGKPGVQSLSRARAAPRPWTVGTEQGRAATGCCSISMRTDAAVDGASAAPVVAAPRHRRVGHAGERGVGPKRSGLVEVLSRLAATRRDPWQVCHQQPPAPPWPSPSHVLSGMSRPRRVALRLAPGRCRPGGALTRWRRKKIPL